MKDYFSVLEDEWEAMNNEEEEELEEEYEPDYEEDYDDYAGRWDYCTSIFDRL